MKIKLWSVVLFGLSTTACVGTLLQPVPLSVDERARLQTTGPITVVMQQTPGFLFNTPPGALVGAGMAKWNDPSTAPSWTKITAEHGVPDFTDSIRNQFVTDLEASVGPMLFKTAQSRQPNSEKQEVGYVSQYATDYVLEFRTHYGSFHYLPLSWKTYAMNYTGQARMIRTADQAIVWKSTCTVQASDDPVLKVPVDDFASEDGKQLRVAASFVTEQCAKQLLQEFLNDS